MDILVCMKQVIDDSVPLDPAGLESASTILNPYDGYALELALRYVPVSYTHLDVYKRQLPVLPG